MRWLLRGVLVSLVLVGCAAAAGYFIIQPPPPMPLPAQGVVLDGVTLIEPGVSRRAEMRLRVDGGQIAEVTAAAANVESPYAGMFVVPGLTDLHVHFPPPTLPGQTELFAFLHLYHGVTSVRDAGDTDGTSTEPARSGVADDRFPGPRVFACGPFVDGPRTKWKNSIVARTPEDGRAAVHWVADAGFNCVKVYTDLDAATLDAIRAAAKQRGLPVIGHVPRRVSFEEALLDDAQHLIGVAPDPDPSLDFPHVLRNWLDVDDARLRQISSTSVENHVSHTPTLVTIDRLAAQRDPDAVRREADAQLLPRFYRDVVWSPDGGISATAGLTAGDFEMIESARRKQLYAVKWLFDAGAELHTGTDTLIPFVVPGAALHRELRLFVEAGLSPEQALRLSTDISPKALGIDKAGQLRPGAPGDLVILRDDPTRNLAALDGIVAVVRDGRLYTRKALDEQLTRYRQHYDGGLHDLVVTPIVRIVLAASKPH